MPQVKCHHGDYARQRFTQLLQLPPKTLVRPSEIKRTEGNANSTLEDPFAKMSAVWALPPPRTPICCTRLEEVKVWGLWGSHLVSDPQR